MGGGLGGRDELWGKREKRPVQLRVSLSCPRPIKECKSHLKSTLIV